MRRARTIALALPLLLVIATNLVRADGTRIEVTASTIDARVGDPVTIDAKLFQGDAQVTAAQKWIWLVQQDSGSLRDGERSDSPTNVYTPDIPGTHKIKVSTREAMSEGVWGEVLIAVRDKGASAIKLDPDRPHEHAFFISPTEVSLRVGETVRFDYTGCTCVDLPSRVQWNVPAGVRLSSERQLTAAATGLYKVRVVSNGITRWITVHVVSPGPRCARIELAPANAIVRTGSSLAFQAQAQDERGNPIKVALAWSTSGGAIDGDGKLAAGDLPGRFQVLCRDPETGVSAVVWVVVDANAHAAASIFLGPRFTRCKPGEFVQLGCRAYDDENNEVPCPAVLFTATAGQVDARARFYAPASAVGTHVSVQVKEPTTGKSDAVDVFVVK